jgi:hypothetical protein
MSLTPEVEEHSPIYHSAALKAFHVVLKPHTDKKRETQM